MTALPDARLGAGIRGQGGKACALVGVGTNVLGFHELHVSPTIQTPPQFGKRVSAWLRVGCRQPGWAATRGWDSLKHLQVLLKCFGFGKTLKCVWPACSPPFSNPCVFQGKFNPYVSDTFTLNSSKYCFVKTTGCPGHFRSSFNGTF